MVRKLTIGNVTLNNNLILAPMAGVTDLPFRLLCKEQGAGLLCMEMISAKAIYYENRNTKALLAIHEGEPPVSLQLLDRIRISSVRWQERSKSVPFPFWTSIWAVPFPKWQAMGKGQL